MELFLYDFVIKYKSGKLNPINGLLRRLDYKGEKLRNQDLFDAV